MKNSYLIISCVLLLISCDAHEVALEPATLKTDSDLQQRMPSAPPFNDDVTYDIAGQVYSELFQDYYDSPALPTSLDSIIDLVHLKMSVHDYYKALPNFNYYTFTNAEIESIITHPTNHLSKAFDESLLTTYAKTHFQSFLDDLALHIDDERDYAFIYDFIVSYESAVSKNAQHNSDDKELILTVTSIARHSIYHKDKKPKKNTDPDWNWLITCISGSIHGGNIGMPDAISMSLKTGIGSE